MSDFDNADLVLGHDAPVDLQYVSNLRNDLSETFDLSMKQIEELHEYQEPISPGFIWDDQVFLGRVTSMRLPGSRDRFIHRTHNLLRSRHDNGWIATGFYALHEADSFKHDVNQYVPALFEAINRSSTFPTPFKGCSAYPLQQGLFVERTTDEFAKEMYSILRSGGAYAKPLDQEISCKEITAYMKALIGPYESNSLKCFGLDPCFSISFFGIAWDFAYILIHTTESWAALITGTDTD